MRVLPEAVTTRSIVISARVSVPVLSVQITEAAPSVSTDDRFLTMALCFAMRCTPMASTTDRIAGKPSGTAATASDTPSSSTATTSAAVRMSEISRIVATTTVAITTTAMPSMRPMRATSMPSGVGASMVASSMPAMAPTSVCMPVAVTTARPVPCAMAVPLNTMSSRSPSAAGADSVVASFSTASLSPVNDASSTRNDEASSKRASAPTASPSPSTSRSPGTSSALGTRSACPSRTTADVTAVMRASAATAFAALACWTKPSTPLSNTTIAITSASSGQPAKPSIAQAPSAMPIAANSR